MEEVWEGISLSSLHQDVPSTPPSLSATAASAATAPSSLASVRGMVLQDFLTRGSQKGGRGEAGDSQPSEEPLERKPQPQPHGVERQRNRMMHNRESASRSRARKRAYTDELEKEVGRLRCENRALRAQSEKLQKAVEHQFCVATKRTLQRTLTAPF